MRILLLITVLYIIPFFVSAQDTIFVKTGQKIVCKVINSDSINVYYDVLRKGQSTRYVISKQEVQNIKYYSGPIAYNNKHSNAILFSVGASIAIGDFASDDLHSEISGLAGNGLNYNIIFKHSFTPNVYFIFKGYHCNNQFKANKISEVISSLTGLSVVSNSVSYWIWQQINN